MELWMRELITLSVTAAFTAAAVLLVRLLLLRVPRVYVCALWIAVFVRAVLPVTFSSRFSLRGLLELSMKRTEGTAGAAFGGPAANMAARGIGTQTVPGTQGVQVSVLEAGAEAMASQNGLRADIWLAAAGIWLLVLAVLLMYSLASFLKLRKAVAFSVKTEDGLYESDQIETAFVLGFFRPRIYLPEGLSAKERRMIAEHERVHVRRHDHQLKLIAWLIVLIHWFNPVLWLSFWLFGRDMELACDERVLKNLGLSVRADYGEALLSLASPRRFPSGVPLAFGESSIRARIKHVTRYQPVKSGVRIVAVLLVAVTFAGCISDPAEKKTGIGKQERQAAAAALDAETEELLTFGRSFAGAVAARDADTVYEMLSPGLREQAEDYGIYEAENGQRVMGFSSPFVQDEQDITVTLTGEKLQYRMLAVTSDPSWYVWKGQLTPERTADGKEWQAGSWREQLYTEVTSLEDCLNAYGEGIPDYRKDVMGMGSFGDLIQKHYEEGTYPEYYGQYTEPAAALALNLHLENGISAEVRTEEDGRTALVTYSWADGAAVFRMIRQTDDGIWIPTELMETKTAEVSEGEAGSEP